MIRLPILTYHSIDSSGSVISTSPRLFRDQVEFLADRGFRTLSLTAAMEELKRETKPSQPIIVLTFDDGFLSVFEEAFPILRNFGYSGTCFVVTDYCGRRSNWPGQLHGIPRLPLMHWHHLRALREAGWELGCHSATHARLTELDDAALDRELDRCAARLAETTDVSSAWFAYPFGAHDSRVRQRVGKLFRGACGTELAFASSASDPLALERIDMYYLRHAGMIRAMGSRGLRCYLECRRSLRRLRGH